MIGLLIGVGVTVLVALVQAIQAKQAAQEAEAFAKEARNTLRIIVKSLEQAGMAEVHWDDDVPLEIVMHYRLEAEPGHFEFKGGNAELGVTRADGSMEVDDQTARRMATTEAVQSLEAEIREAGHDIERRRAQGDPDVDDGDLWVILVDRLIVAEGTTHEELERQLQEWWEGPPAKGGSD